MKMSKEEKTILDSVEKGERKSVRGAKEKIKKYQEYAKATFRKDKRVNIRISEKDLVGIQKKAVEEGLPYQTLISSVLHKFISGRLTEKKHDIWPAIYAQLVLLFEDIITRQLFRETYSSKSTT